MGAEPEARAGVSGSYLFLWVATLPKASANPRERSWNPAPGAGISGTKRKSWMKSEYGFICAEIRYLPYFILDFLLLFFPGRLDGNFLKTARAIGIQLNGNVHLP
jgi:hypothetical protein